MSSLSRWWRQLIRGVEDFVPADVDKEDDPRLWVYKTIDNSPFQAKVVFVAGVGFLTDAYDIFALNVVVPILGYVYWTDGMPQNYQTALLCTSLAGTLLGQLIFGFLGDMFGRRRMYGFELIVLIIGSIGSATASTGAADSMSIVAWLVFWRLMMGIGIGADYPLSAVLTAEFAPRRHRARMLAYVFWMQPLGQLLALAVALVVVKSSEYGILATDKPRSCDGSPDCIRALDSAWRWIVGLGAVPALLAISFRLLIPESPRYLMDVARKVDTAANKTAGFYIPSAVQPGHALNLEQIRPLRHNDYNSNLPNADYPNPLAPHHLLSRDPYSAAESQHEAQTISETASIVSSISLRAPSVVDKDNAPASHTNPKFWGKARLYFADVNQYFVKEGNWRLLAGTAGNWLLLDIPFYGLGLSYSTVVDRIFASTPLQSSALASLYSFLLAKLLKSLIIISVGAVVGGAIFIKVIKYASPKTIQFWGFVVSAVLLIVTGSAFSQLGPGLVVLYVLIQLFFNLGPNTTTYMISAELFPTRFRCTCAGISAASGKLGAIVAQLFVAYSRFGTVDPNFPLQTWLGHGLQIFCAFMAAGAVLTWWLTPETRDAEGKSRTLEDLGQGHLFFKKERTLARDARRASS